MSKKEWKVPVNWQMTGQVKVEANTLEEAMLKVKNDSDEIPLPDKQYYIDSSFELSYDMHEVEFVRKYENEGQEDSIDN